MAKTTALLWVLLSPTEHIENLVRLVKVATVD
jgi:hypothetical protein